MPFPGFSEAARLYANNVAVIETMRQAFETNLQDFCQSIVDELNQRGLKCGYQKTRSGYNQVWLDGTWGNDVPWITFKGDPTILSEEKIQFAVNMENEKGNPHSAQVLALVQDSDFQKYGLQESKLGWAVLQGEIAVPMDDPLREIVPLYALVLPKITAAYHNDNQQP